MKDIKHIFFDLDHTLWDFDKNSSEALSELFFELALNEEIENLTEFIAIYQRINAKYWNLYNHGKVTKEQVRNDRFIETLNHFEVRNAVERSKILGTRYIETSPHKTHLFPDAHETLTYLQSKYKLHIITNGFSEVQHIKLHNTKLKDYFDMILCTEEVGVNKPHPLVFETALAKTKAKSFESIMIGDNPETDILGAKNCGFSTVLFNPNKGKTNVESIEIQGLKELTILL
ncbi:YjjG family noncanonical pyrimidine nucleotidase [Crocinitomix sp.]|nr:YjjG family noncanonical pyrimidine nucleotidase [Crocinitomix sp.]